MDQTYIEQDTKDIARQILANLPVSDDAATVLALKGDLGAGKTTLTKSLAELLGVRETVVSPTFVIAKFYQTTDSTFKQVVHIDAYRIESIDELKPLGWEQVIQQPQTLVIVEWPERIAEALPQNIQHYMIAHNGDERIITSTTL